MSRRRRRRIPYPWDSGVAELAAVSDQVISGNEISPAFNQQFFAVMTVGVVAIVAGHIADIGVMNSLLHSQFSIVRQRGHRGRGQAIQLVAREKPQKVQRIIRADVF